MVFSLVLFLLFSNPFMFVSFLHHFPMFFTFDFLFAFCFGSFCLSHFLVIFSFLIFNFTLMFLLVFPMFFSSSLSIYFFEFVSISSCFVFFFHSSFIFLYHLVFFFFVLFFIFSCFHVSDCAFDTSHPATDALHHYVVRHLGGWDISAAVTYPAQCDSRASNAS